MIERATWAANWFYQMHLRDAIAHARAGRTKEALNARKMAAVYWRYGS